MARKKKTDPAGTPDEVSGDYVVLARKYRPQTFDDLIGQEAMVATLRNAFAAGRVAQGFMLTGVRGVGKTTTARILARALNYETDKIAQSTIDMETPGRHCAEIMQSRHPDVIEMDAASNTGVENVREIIESARYRPLVARMKVFIIDEVHMLSKGAFNALLKTLEEPPEHVKFIFATTEIHKVPVTVLSRCQRFDLRRVDVPMLTEHLEKIAKAEGTKAEDDALALIAKAAEGSVRDALSILDQAIAFSKGKVKADGVRAMLGLADRGRIFELFEQLVSGAVADALKSFDALYRDGAEPVQILRDLSEAVHLATRIKVTGEEQAIAGISQQEWRHANELAQKLTMGLLARLWQMLLKGLDEVARAPAPETAAEMVLIRIAYTADLPAPDEVIKKLGGVPTRASGGMAKGNRDAQPTGSRAGSQAIRTESAVASGDGARATTERPDVSRSEQAASQRTSGPATFADVIALASQKRDAKLTVQLEDHVSLVKFDAEAGSIDLFLMREASKDLANELRESLNAWTGRNWVVVLSKSPGERPVGDVRREHEAADLDAVKKLPEVKAVLDVFPDAQVSVEPRDTGTQGDVTGVPDDGERKDDSATG